MLAQFAQLVFLDMAVDLTRLTVQAQLGFGALDVIHVLIIGQRPLGRVGIDG